MLQLSNISAFKNSNEVLTDISFIIPRYQKTAIAGETGTGKTSLLKIMGALMQPASGHVYFEETRVPGPDEKLIAGHHRIAYISQHFELRNNYRVEEELDYTNQLSETSASEIYKICRISHLLKRWSDELSGGEKQRIVTARALVSAPSILLLDEPFSNLDNTHTQLMKTVIHDITEKLKITCVLVSHDPLDMLSWADEILVLKEGKLLQKGDPKQIYLQPIDEYCAGLFGRYNLVTLALVSHFPALAYYDHIVIRPEYFEIDSIASADSAKGIIRKILFMGSYLEIDVSIEDITIVLRTAVSDFVVDDIVFISLKKMRSA